MSCPARWAARFGQATLELAAELRRVSAEVGLRPEQVAYVGDRLDNDVLPAKVAGMFAVFLRRGPWVISTPIAPERRALTSASTRLPSSLPPFDSRVLSRDELGDPTE